jgi:4a-hydroxytetrahydrobiopterin dehydratase
MALLTQEELDRALANELSSWIQEDGPAIARMVEADSFMDGIELVRRVAEKADEADHHPDIDIRYTSLRFALSTHSEGGITRKDIDLAGAIDRVLG